MSDDAARLLHLLAADASSGRLRDCAPPGQALADALAVRETIDAHKRRESVLTALVDIARDLTSRPDPDGVLDTIVRRARSLLGADVAYLTLYDADRGDTFMRATDGSISAAFQTVRLPLGAGLGGLVAATRRPYTAHDYPNDARFTHTREIDSAVHDEGLVAICGTPLLAGDAFVGVLFASDRSARTFTADEVASLGSLAALAAVSIVQSRAAARTNAVLAEVSLAHEQVRRYSVGIERAATAHDRFAGLVLAGGGVQDLCSAVSELLGGWSIALDPHGRRLGAAGDAPGEGLAGHPAVLAARESGRLSIADGMAAVPIRAAGELLGDLILGDLRVLDGVGAMDDADRRTVERAAVVTALVLLRQRAAADAEQRLAADLVSDLITGAGDLARRRDRAAAVGLDVNGPWSVAVARLPASAHLRGAEQAARSAAGPTALIGRHAGDLVVIAPGTDSANLARALGSRLAPLGEVTCSAAGPVRPDDVIGAFREAAHTVDALVALGLAGSAATADALGFAGLVVSAEPDVDRFLSRQLGPLQTYDSERGTELLATVRALFQAAMNRRRAAEMLHIHPNTLSQRLDRVSRLLGPGWAEPGAALELQLALRLHSLRTRD